MSAIPARAGWSPAVDEGVYRAEAARSNADLIPRPLSIRVRVVPREHIEWLLREIELVGQLFDRDRDVIALHVDAEGTAAPAARDLEVLTGSLDRHFHLAPETRRRYSLRLSTASGRDDLGDYRAAGFDSVTLVMDPPHDGAARAVEMARLEGMRSVAVEAALADHHVPEALLASRPERMTLSLPNGASPASALGQLEQLAQMAAQLVDAGYVDVGLDPRPMPEFDASRPVELTAAMQGTRPPWQDTEADLVGLGPGAVSRVHDALCENFPGEERWRGALDTGVLPLWRGLVLDADGRLRMDVIAELLRHGVVAIDAIARRHDVDFHRYFERELARLEEAFGSLVRVGPWRLETTSQGRLVLRIIAACFDTPRTNPAR